MEPNIDQPAPENSPSIPASPQYRVIAGFWRRLFAFVIDVIILSIVGAILGYFFSEFFIKLGDYGTLIGFPIALAYFGLFNSSLGKGQTPGKRLLKIQVVDVTGHYLPPAIATLRYAVLAFPFFVTPNLLPNSLKNTWVYYLLGSLSGIWALTIIYLLVFNRRTRQSLHDFIAHSYVVDTYSVGIVNATPLWKGHRLILFGVFVWLAFTSFAIVRFTSQMGVMTNVFELQKNILATQKFRGVGVSISRNTYLNNGNSIVTSNVSLAALCKGHPQNKALIARQLAEIVLANYPKLRANDYLNIQVAHGYDIGIYKSDDSESFRHTPNQWEKILADPNALP